MDINSVMNVWFSPTGTTKKIISEISVSLCSENVSNVDLTLPIKERAINALTKNDLLLIGVPVYSGRVPQIAIERISMLKGTNTPAVIVAVYGNAKIDDALLELKDIIEEVGFKTIAAATFIGEHSFSTDERPVAKGRPDSQDIAIARSFGVQIKNKLKEFDSINDSTSIEVPGNAPYKVANQLSLGVPDIDMNKCSECKTCAEVCPTGAIVSYNQKLNDDKKCITCYACIKSCPEGARFQDHPVIEATKDKLYKNFQLRKEPELML